MYNWNNVFKQALNWTSPQSASGDFTIVRPDYTSNTTPEISLTPRQPVPARMDAAGPTYTKTKISGVQYFDVFFDRLNLPVMAGDVFLREPRHNTPPITVLECEDLQQCVGVKTSLIGSLYLKRPLSTPTNLLVSNIRFNYMGTLGPEPGIDPEMPSSYPLEQRRIITWTRSDLIQGRYFRDNCSGKLYRITELQGEGRLTVLFLVLAGKEA